MTMQSPRWKVVLVWTVCLFGALFALPNALPDRLLEGLPSFFPKDRVRLGLDLSGGAHLLLEVDLSAADQESLNQTIEAVRVALRKGNIGYVSMPTAVPSGEEALTFSLRDGTQAGRAKALLSALDPNLKVTIEGTVVRMAPTEMALAKRHIDVINRSIEVIRRRIDETGTREPVIQGQGKNRILLQVPGEQDPVRIKELLGRTAKLSFRLVEEAQSGSGNQPGCVSLPQGDGQGERLRVRRSAIIGGEHLVDAQPGFDEYNRPQVSFRLNTTGAKRFGDATRENVHRRFAIVLDDRIISAPVINEPIPGGSGRISGQFTAEEAHDLALLLRAGALPAPLVVVEERTVGPDLGADSIKAGVYATFIAILLVVGFMLLAYSLFGLVADTAVIVNLILLVAALSCLRATLTLPGIAGIALTMGMAVDANVLINERIKEELRRGMRPLVAVEQGYDLAMTTIIDTNLNTLIGMAFLYHFGTGPIRGFAVTTALGVVISFFTSTTLARLLTFWWMGKKRPTTLPI
ncbi:MAG: protein translocase subunit SecD [Holosporales bacterium]|jgi:preprotein translocase subunit SecD|nr:protein translocase subunit SecD [Holosporales bacterium]